MGKEQIRFLISGLLFGFLLGYIVAYGVYEPGVVGRASPVPAAGNMGMSGPAPVGAAGNAGAGGTPREDEMMARVFEEIAALKAAIERDPEDHPALVRLANLYHDAGMFEQAVGYYGRALEARPSDVNARTDMGICLRELGRADEAIAEFRRSLEIEPRHWQSWLNLGIVTLFDKKDVAAASEAFAKVEEINPTYRDLPLLKEAVTKARQAASGGG
ncbi:MAG: tetratricopeptide repeat protein [Acidobacteriota bacterium]